VRWIFLTPYSRQVYREACERLKNDGLMDFERAYYFLIANAMSFGGRMGSGWGYKKLNDGQVRTWNNLPRRIMRTAERLRNVILECDDFENVMRKYDSPDTFFFCDPPYLQSSLINKNCRYFSHEFTRYDHLRLLNLVKELKGKIMITHYECDLYDEMLTGWRKIVVERKIWMAWNIKERKRPSHRVRECIYLNYDPKLGKKII